MGTFSIWHWLIVLVVVVLLFGGGGKIPRIMGDIAKGIKSFRQNVKDDDSGEEKETAKIDRTEGSKDETARS